MTSDKPSTGDDTQRFQRLGGDRQRIGSRSGFSEGAHRVCPPIGAKAREFFFSISKRIESNRTYVQILQMLEADDPKVAEVPLGDRRELLGLFEEVAILLNSGLVRESVAHYFFGYFAIDCGESGPMWTGLDRESPHWIVLRDFVSRMKDYGARASYDRSRYRF